MEGVWSLCGGEEKEESVGSERKNRRKGRWNLEEAAVFLVGTGKRESGGRDVRGAPPRFYWRQRGRIRENLAKNGAAAGEVRERGEEEDGVEREKGCDARVRKRENGEMS
ncbi:hypothetical protein HAX54_028634 [Datura stramonium]|uniref:Uncharacterized protein n=1 Tax=Datura stramonium TaxID=4076 RepID=A0ABS8V5D0_DATST|nr:hypothetical protein [Datura stramonium]